MFETDVTKTQMDMIFGIESDHRGILDSYIKPGTSDVLISYNGIFGVQDDFIGEIFTSKPPRKNQTQLTPPDLDTFPPQGKEVSIAVNADTRFAQTVP